MQDRQAERGGFARSGLGGRDDIAAFEHERNGLLLDRGGGFVAKLFDRHQAALGQAEIGEIGHASSFAFGVVSCDPTESRRPPAARRQGGAQCASPNMSGLNAGDGMKEFRVKRTIQYAGHGRRSGSREGNEHENHRSGLD